MGRTSARAGIDTTGRLQLVEDDLDATDAKFVAIEARTAAGLDALDARLGKIMWAMVGILISLTTTSIVILLTVGLGR